MLQRLFHLLLAGLRRLGFVPTLVLLGIPVLYLFLVASKKAAPSTDRIEARAAAKPAEPDSLAPRSQPQPAKTAAALSAGPAETGIAALLVPDKEATGAVIETFEPAPPECRGAGGTLPEVCRTLRHTGKLLPARGFNPAHAAHINTWASKIVKSWEYLDDPRNFRANGTASLQEEIRAWEQKTGKSFLLDHPSMKRHPQEGDPSVWHVASMAMDDDTLARGGERQKYVTTAREINTLATIRQSAIVRKVTGLATRDAFSACLKKYEDDPKWAAKLKALPDLDPRLRPVEEVEIRSAHEQCYLRLDIRDHSYSGQDGVCLSDPGPFAKNIVTPGGMPLPVFVLRGEVYASGSVPVVCGEEWRRFMRQAYSAKTSEELTQADLMYQYLTLRLAAARQLMQRFPPPAGS